VAPEGSYRIEVKGSLRTDRDLLERTRRMLGINPTHPTPQKQPTQTPPQQKPTPQQPTPPDQKTRSYNCRDLRGECLHISEKGVSCTHSVFPFTQSRSAETAGVGSCVVGGDTDTNNAQRDKENREKNTPTTTDGSRPARKR